MFNASEVVGLSPFALVFFCFCKYKFLCFSKFLALAFFLILEYEATDKEIGWEQDEFLFSMKVVYWISFQPVILVFITLLKCSLRASCLYTSFI